MLHADNHLFKQVDIDVTGPKDPWVKIIGDIDNDGFPDIIIGGRNGPLVWYRYPDWKKFIVSPGGYATVDGEAGDVDGDGDLDLVLGGLIWYENPLPDGSPENEAWMEHRIADHRTHDIELSDLDGDGDMDVVTRDQSAFGEPRGSTVHIWRQEEKNGWTERILECPDGEGIVVADIDGDRDDDIVINGIWFENPKDDVIAGEWTRIQFAEFHENASVATADFNHDGRRDVVLAPAELKENYYHISWFEGPDDPKSGNWKEHVILKNVETVVHALQAADVNGDGEVDVLMAEMHQGKDPDEVVAFLNKGGGAAWQKMLLSEKGSHLIRIGDIGNDGDIDIMGANWSGDYQPIQLWENQTATWQHHSSLTGELPVPAVGRQVATIILDIDKDGRNDFVIPSYERMVWYRQGDDGWQRYAIENGDPGVRMEAGGESHDIDGDGDLDIVMAAQSNAGEIWWWENPYPDYSPGRPWQRYEALRVGGTHHDQIFGDFDVDGEIELAFWYNRGKQLYLAEIPADPKTTWPFTEIARFDDDKPRPEGLAKIDIDLDGKIDIVGGGYWFKHISGTEFSSNVIDPEYRFTRTAVGDLVKGGRPEVVIGSGDQTGPLNMYEWRDNGWQKTTLVGYLDHGHTLRVADIDADGNPDVYTAEMYRPGALHECRQMILYGDGKGKFRTVIISTGLGTHEGRIADFNSDGFPDILQKDFQQHRRVDIWLNPKK